MEDRGVKINLQRLQSENKLMSKELVQLETQIYETAGKIFNLNSSQQLGKILFEVMGIEPIKRTKSGYSTDVDSLEKIKWEHPVVEKILDYRQTAKLYSTYVEGMIPYINSKTGRIHSYFHQTVTATGRLSSTDPNLQNIPTRFEAGRKLRQVFKPEEGYIYIDADYSQIELRVLAHIAKDENMINAFINGEDIHRQVASQVFNTPINEVTKEQRSHAKAVNFGIVYGMSDYGLSEEIGVPVKVAKNYIQSYFEKYPKINTFKDMNLILKPPYEFPSKRRIYYGEWKDNEIYGRGVQQWLDGSRYEGYFIDGKASIKGKLFHSNGDTYEGEWLNNKANGHGIYIHIGGEYYDGDWKDDKQNGKGKETWIDGSSYEGDYISGKRYGYGIFKWPDGSEYEGDYVKGVREGLGKFTWSNGNTFKGVFKKGKPNGKGTVTNCGFSYQAEYKNGNYLSKKE